MFQVEARTPTTHTKFTVDKIAKTVMLMERLGDRETVTPEELTEAIRIREKNVGRGGFVPLYSISSLFPGTFYLDEVRKDFTRVYHRKPLNSPRIKGLFYPVHGSKILMVERIPATTTDPQTPLLSIGSPRVREIEFDEKRPGKTTTTTTRPPSITNPLSSTLTTTGRTSNGSRSFAFDVCESPLTMMPMKSPAIPSKDDYLRSLFQTCTRTTTSTTSPPAPVVVTGTAAGLPGRDSTVFSDDNLTRLIKGENFITRLNQQTVADLIDKNVVGGLMVEVVVVVLVVVVVVVVVRGGRRFGNER